MVKQKAQLKEMPHSPGTWSFLAGLGKADTCGGRDWGGGRRGHERPSLPPASESTALTPQARGGMGAPPKNPVYQSKALTLECDGDPTLRLEPELFFYLMNTHPCVAVISVQFTTLPCHYPEI